MLSGASCGWSARMIGDDSSRSVRSGGPGEHRPGVLVAAARRGAARPTRGGSVGERNAPGSAASRVCAAISDVRSASSRGAPVAAGGVVDDVEAQPVARRTGRAASAAETTIRPVSGQQRADVAAGDPVAVVLLGSRTPGHAIGSRRAGAAARRRANTASTCRGTPSSNGTCRRRPSTELVDRAAVGIVRRCGLQLQEAQPHVQLGAGPGARAGTSVRLRVGLGAGSAVPG